MDLSIESSSYSFEMSSHKRRVKKKLCIIAVGLLTAVMITLIITLPVVLLRRTKEFQSEEVCSSNDCKIAGNYLLTSVNVTLDPCKDFYEFTCSSWVQNHVLNNSIFRVTDIPKAKMEETLSGLFDVGQHIIQNKLVLDAFKFYKSCLNSDRIETAGIVDLKEFLKMVIKAPLLHNDFKVENFNWLLTIGNVLRNTGSSYLLRWSYINLRNTSRNIIILDRSYDSMQYTGESDKDKADLKFRLYKEFMIKVFSLLNPEIEEKSRVHDIEEVLSFVKNIAELAPKNSDGRPENRILNVTVLQKEYPGVNWLEYLKAITDETLLPLNQAITANEEINLLDPEYVKKLLIFMENPENKRQAANYIAWELILSRINLLPVVFLEAYDNFATKYPWPEKVVLPERNQTCMNFVHSSFPEILAYLYIQHNFPPDAQKKALEMVNLLSKQLETMIKTAAWLDRKTSSKALKKLEKMILQVGYPSWLASIDEINHIYKEMNSSIGEDILKNVIIMQKFQTHNAIKALKIPPRVQIKMGDVLSVSALYYRNLNEILITAAMLQSPFYYPDTPWYMNFGAIGTVIGHEMTHGFDTEGKKRDENGSLTDWWSDESTAAYDERTNCFVSQYNDYHVNGTETLSENIADTGGLQIAYHAYKEYLKELGTEPKIPHFESFTLDQLFFIAYGSIWCSSTSDESVGVHSPSRYRLTGSLSNMREFSETFNCDNKAAMNPEKKCLIW